MSVLYIDASMGISGIKLLGALVGCMERPELFIRKVNECGFEGIRLESRDTAVKGISGRVLDFTRTDEEDYGDEVDDDGTETRRRHRSVMRTLGDVEEIINDLSVSGNVRRRAAAVYEMMAKASAGVHGRDERDIVLHRTGSRDVIASVVGVFMALEELRPDKVISSAVAVGTGRTRTSRGETDIPAPVVAKLLDGVEYTGGTESFETCTADGAALISSIADGYSEMPAMTVLRSGAGFGMREYRGGVNCVRAMFGNIAVTAANSSAAELETELYGDGCTGLEYCLAGLVSLGAKDAYTLPLVSAVSGRGVLLRVICGDCTADEIAGYILKNTGARSVRRRGCVAYELDETRQEIKTSLGGVRVTRLEGFGIAKTLPLGEDVAAAAAEKEISYAEAYKRISMETD